MGKLIPLIFFLVFCPFNQVLAQPAPEGPLKTTIDLLSRNSPAGWSLATLQDGRPVALWIAQGATPAKLVLSCLPTGEFVAAGGPGRFITEGEVETTIPIMSNRVMSRGVLYLIDLLATENNSAKMNLITEEIPSNPTIVRPVKDYCEKLQGEHPEAEFHKTSDDLVWHGSGNSISYSTLMGDDFLGVSLTCQNKSLEIQYFQVPPKAKDKQTTSLLIVTGKSRYNVKGVVSISSDGMGLESTTATARSPSAILADLSNDEVFAIGWNETIQTALPTTGLSYLIDRYLKDCKS